MSRYLLILSVVAALISSISFPAFANSAGNHRSKSVQKKKEPRRPTSLLDIDLKLENFGFDAGARTRFTRLINVNAALGGGFLAVSFNRVVNVGYAQYGLLNRIELEDHPGRQIYNVRGLAVEIADFSELDHLRFGVFIGYLESGFESDSDGEQKVDKGLVIEPSIGWGINLVTWLRIEYGYGYRFVSLPKEAVISSRDLYSASFFLGISGGKF